MVEQAKDGYEKLVARPLVKGQEGCGGTKVPRQGAEHSVKHVHVRTRARASTRDRPIGRTTQTTARARDP
eukprot:118336-Chlamydomonas_euryale.AAC.3